jgi:uncharacterized repeat protein (TIGR01451 family)
MTHQRRPSAATVEPVGAPAWFRYGVIAAAAIIMCSCRTAKPEYRVAAHEPAAAVVRLQSPDAAPSQSFTPPARIPSHLTAGQIARATSLPPGFRPAACHAGCCACCSNGPARGPDDEYLCDGGDYGLPAGVRADWSIVGLESEDTIAHYDTVDGRTIVTPSNKVCIYAPRFAAVRQVIDLREYANAAGPEGAIQKVAPVRVDERDVIVAATATLEPTINRRKLPPSLLGERLHPGELARDRRLGAVIGTLAPYADVQVVRTGEVIGVDIAKIARSSLAAITWAGDQAAQVLIDNQQAVALVNVQTPGTIYHRLEPNHPKLRLIKLASTCTAQPGEEVEFTLRFDNVGDRVIGNVTIVDHLTTRLEYVPDSQKSTAEANFSTQSNEGGSLTLRWEIVAPVQPGDGGVLQFHCKVR